MDEELAPNRPEVLLTGSGWIGHGCRSIESGLRSLLMEARREVTATVYSLADYPEPVFGAMRDALSRGVETTLVVNQLHMQPRAALRRLASLAEDSGHLSLWDYSHRESSVHAKVWLADRCVYLIGSANMSRRGFSDNHEVALMYRDARTGEQLGAAVDRLLRAGLVTIVDPSTL